METTTKQEYIDEAVEKLWGGRESWRKYYNGSVSDVYKTQTDHLVEFGKPTIETKFCFSYDEHIDGSYEDASKRCNVQEDYFVEHNLKSMKRSLDNLIKSENIYLRRGNDKSLRIAYWVTDEYKESYPSDNYIEVSEEDRQGLIKMQEQEIEKFIKRLITYLKKYGTSKLTSWTYSCWD